MYPKKIQKTQMSWSGEEIFSHVLKKPDVHVDAVETGGLVPIELLIHATTELCDVPGGSSVNSEHSVQVQAVSTSRVIFQACWN